MPEQDVDVVKELERLEAERCRAISQYDWVALRDLLHSDFVYGFLSGRLEDKETYLIGLPNRPHGVTSRSLSTRIYGDGTVGVMVSTFISTNASTGAVANEGTALGTWVRTDDGWKIVAYHSTRTGPAA